MWTFQCSRFDFTAQGMMIEENKSKALVQIMETFHNEVRVELI